MKKITVTAIIAAIAFIGGICINGKAESSTDPTASNAAPKDDSLDSAPAPAVSPSVADTTEILVADTNFEKIVTYIKKKGIGVIAGDPCSDYYLPIFDSTLNEHVFTALRRDSNGKPSMDGQINKINAVCIRKGDTDREQPLVYKITRDKVEYDNSNPANVTLVKKGFNKLLQEATEYSTQAEEEESPSAERARG